MSRPTWDEYFMNIAFETAKRSTCPKRHVGAVLVRENKIISTGYNGSPPGLPHCDENGCLLNEQGNCIRTIHAVISALVHADNTNDFGQKKMYVTDQPCVNCLKAIIAAGVTHIFYSSTYHSNDLTLYMQELEKQFHRNLIIDRMDLYIWKDKREQNHAHYEPARVLCKYKDQARLDLTFEEIEQKVLKIKKEYDRNSP